MRDLILDDHVAYLGRLLIPPNLRRSCIDSLYKGHLEMSKMHLQTKRLYLPGKNQESRSKLEKCIPCQAVARSQQKE